MAHRCRRCRKAARSVTSPEGAPCASALHARLAPHRLGNKVVYLGHQGGRAVASFVYQGLAYTFSADLPVSVLTRLVQDVVRGAPDPLPFPGPDAPVDAVPASAPGGP